MAETQTSPHGTRSGFVHEALVYRDEAELDTALQAFVHDAAAAGEPVLIAMPSHHLDRARRVVGDEVGEIRFEDLGRVGRNPGRVLPMIEEWVVAHSGRARVVSEVVWPGRSYAESIEGLRHEALVNYALADSEAKVMSPFDAEHLDPDVLAGVEMTHPTVLDGGRRRASIAYRDPLAVPFDELWPLPEPPGPVSEHPLQGSLLDLRHAVADDPALGSLSAQRRSDLVLAVNEAATNAVRHGDDECLTRIWHEGDEVVTEVSMHTGIPDVMAGRRRPPADALDGRGLWLINQVCDLVELRSTPSGTTLRLHVRDN
jgi:anti-sigma regulatory factor (Ser/Thr protein kinase)